MNIHNVILNDLKERLGNRINLTPADLVEILGKSEGQQANQRSENTFPIPYTKDGSRIKITIYALAEYLANCSVSCAKSEFKNQAARRPDKPSRAEKKKRIGNLEKGWWLIRRAAIVSIIRRSFLEFELAVGSATKLKKIIKP